MYMLHTTQLNPFLAISQQEVLAFGSVWKPAHKWLMWTGKIGTEPMGIYLHSIKYTLCTNFNLYINSKPQSLLQMISFLILLKGGKMPLLFCFLWLCVHINTNKQILIWFFSFWQLDKWTILVAETFSTVYMKLHCTKKRTHKPYS